MRAATGSHLIASCLVVIYAASSITALTASTNSSSKNQSTSSHPDIVAQYSLTGKDSTYFTHLAYDRKRSVLYAAATNRILQLNKNLSQLGESLTGPKHDSPSCHAGGCHKEAETEETNNHNKLLIVSDHNDTLIACGSVRQGTCEIYNLNTFPKNPEDVGFAVAANDEYASTYAFIGPSRYQSWKREEVLYVGVTFTNVGDYRHDVPAISSRKLSGLDIAEFSIQQTMINIDVKYRDIFLVDYVYGFNTSDYAYFMVVQKKSHLAEESGYITRLARVCVSDPNYDSYTEVTIQCMVEGGASATGGGTDENYNILRDAKLTQAGQKLAQQLRIKRDDLVLVTVFSPSKEITNEPQDKSAMCIYSMEEVEEMFSQNIHLCFNGSNSDRNLDYISGTINNGKCNLESRNIFDFCSVGLKLSGMAPIVGRSLFSFDNESITSVTTAQTGPHNLAFLGTTDGCLKKVLISGRDPGQYQRIKVDDQRILPDTMLSPKQDYLYVMSRRKITKLRVEHCNQYANCSSCLESRDPFCGWCSLEKRCTIRNACQKDQAASRWLSHGNGQQCIDFEMVQPDRLPVDEMANVHLVIRTLPELPMNAKYKCVFGNATPIEAVVVENGLRCPTPPLKYRPGIPARLDHVLVPLSVRSSETNKDFVSRSFAFFDCGRHETCRGCVSSQWGCNWCLYDNVCVHNRSTCRTSITNGVIHREDYCPRLKKPATPILLPCDRRKEIRLEVENLPRPQSGHSGFTCMITMEGANMGLPAKVEGNRFVVCEPTEYSYEARTAEYEATVEVRWNRNHYVDTTTITLYKCEVLGSHREHSDCSLCVTRDPKYQCTWCGNKCDYNQTCERPTSQCPRPRIDVIKPLAGPIEGGTLITIEGSNLGIREEDVRNKIWIGDVPCELENYEISVRIECRTGRVTHEMAAPVKVGNHAGYTDSPIKFQYKDVRLEGLSPSMGPQSGGTTLSIIGKDLNIGSKITAFLDDYECLINITQASSGRLNCVTSAARGKERIQTLTLVIDGANRTYPDRGLRPYVRPGESIYNYTQDPKIMQIKPLKSFVSGGRMITVHGTNLDSIQKPEIEVYANEERVNKSTCTVISAHQMECPSPSVKGKFEAMRRAALNQTTRKKRKRSVTENLFTTIGYFSSSVPSGGGYSVATPGGHPGSDAPPAALKQETQLSLQIRFVMDNVQSVHDLNKYFPRLRSTLVYVEDPRYQQFPAEDGVKLYKGDTLVIEGELLNVASDDTDVQVNIGTASCNRTSLAANQLVCIPPDQQPLGTDENGVDTPADLPLVVVRVGKNLRFPIGYLKYDLMKGGYGLSTAMIVIMTAIVIVAILLVGVLIVYRRKSTQAEREYKRIQIQMDTLESNVRSECKKAFAELQTDMTDITADLENTGIPTLEHQHYIMKVFFPGVTDHPILNAAMAKMRINGAAPATNYDAAMLQFEQLINNKRFLLMFVETLEQQKSFNIRDKVNVASLLMVVLMNKMEYATDILKSLLLRLIERAVHQKHPQLMLRRTDSVVEKMLTNYMALCMYDYLRDYAGSSLFLLFKAIKHQIEKGLVDAITHDARYSLSDERLLREQIEPEPVTVHIVQDDLDEKIHCKVLDQDTITQVKSKILDALFKSTPYSMRPSVHDIDLEWRHGRGGHLTLQDEDVTTKTINGWRRLNTLAHYGVQQSAVMSLVAKPNDSYGSGGGGGGNVGPGQGLLGGNKSHQGQQSYLNCFYITNTQPHMIINPDMDANGLQPTRVFHLVKPMVDESHFSFKSIASNIISGHALGGYQHHHNPHQHGGGGVERTHKAIPEIFLTRLLRTKGTIQKFVDDFFATILTVNEDLPPAVKWLFDLLDEAALRHGIHDPDVVHAWKSNSLPLRFWVNFIKNPDFIFDIEKTPTVDACLSVIAQTFMDSCSTTELRLGKDSPSNKLLFAKDIPNYRDMVRVFYNDVARLPQVSDQEMGTAMQELSVQQVDEFDVIAALKELYIYVTKYREPLMDNLEMDTGCKKQHLAQKLENVTCTLQGQLMERIVVDEWN